MNTYTFTHTDIHVRTLTDVNVKRIERRTQNYTNTDIYERTCIHTLTLRHKDLRTYHCKESAKKCRFLMATLGC